VVGRRIAAAVRIHLFSALLAQDIGFFDAQMSGQLTSRLTNDVSGMVAPWSTIVNTCLSSSLTLAGGLAMCVYTSWKLSALAMASVGVRGRLSPPLTRLAPACYAQPILFLTSLYAKFSKSMNREIYAALGDANSAATEAMQNIRTVRAFSTEKGEIQRYRSAVNVALGKGVKVSAAGGPLPRLTCLPGEGRAGLGRDKCRDVHGGPWHVRPHPGFRRVSQSPLA
jgi:ABC-type multidrug transport system fused ATPase/permease subunit